MTIKTSIRTIIFAVFCAVFGFTLFDGIQPAEANPDPKIEVCHFQIDNGLYKKLTIGVGAWPDHEMHGDRSAADVDDCNAPPPHLFAVAFINIDGQSGYNADMDIMIASLEDSNDSGYVDIGDFVMTGEYPLSMSECSESMGTEVFTVSSHRLTIIGQANQQVVEVAANVGVDRVDAFAFHKTDTFERYDEHSQGSGSSLFLDSLPGGFQGDIIITDLDSPSRPQSSLSEFSISNKDDCFIDVEINLT